MCIRDRIYRQPDVRLQAANWIRQQVPAGASILVEKDEGLLLHKADSEYSLTGYTWRTWNPYEVDGVTSVHYLAPVVSPAQTAAYLDRLLTCLLYTSDAADERSSVDLGGRRIIKKKNKKHTHNTQHTHTMTDQRHEMHSNR